MESILQCLLNKAAGSTSRIGFSLCASGCVEKVLFFHFFSSEPFPYHHSNVILHNSCNKLIISSLTYNLHMCFIWATPFPPDSYRDFPHGGRSKIILSPVGEIRKGVFKYKNLFSVTIILK
jgi:hypothetical protein